MRKSIKHITTAAAAIAVATFIALGTTSAIAGPGAQDGGATQVYPAQDNCMQSPASTRYTPCWNNG